MRVSRLLVGFSAAVLFTATFSHARTNSKSDTLKLSGLSQSVEILKDHWGISHIYAQTQEDLFFAQGFSAARDRLFQFEMWRRRALGLMAEIQGERALKHDIGARLLKLRQNMELEMQHYHPAFPSWLTSGSDNQRSGGTFRIIADTGDWDRSVGTNAPGQSGNPDDPHYSDLFKMWADGKYFPVFYSRPKVESVTEQRLVLIPAR